MFRRRFPWSHGRFGQSVSGLSSRFERRVKKKDSFVNVPGSPEIGGPFCSHRQFEPVQFRRPGLQYRIRHSLPRFALTVSRRQT